MDPIEIIGSQRNRLFALVLGASFGLGGGCIEGRTGESEVDWRVSVHASGDGAHKTGGDRDKSAVAVPKPPFSKGIYPCSDCHDGDFDPKPRSLEDDHPDIKLNHGERERWCLDCHNPTDRDKLRLASGSLVTFETSYRLCGQCHGPKLRDWRAGVHGKRTGYWNGPKQYRLCVHCHNPHSPAFEPLKPQPAPRLPGEVFVAGSDADLTVDQLPDFDPMSPPQSVVASGRENDTALTTTNQPAPGGATTSPPDE